MERARYLEQLCLFWSLLLAISLTSVSSANVDDLTDKCQFSKYESDQAEIEGKAKISPLIGHTYVLL